MIKLGEISFLTNDVNRLADFYKALLNIDNHSRDDTHQFLIADGVQLTVYNDGCVKNNRNENICLAFTVDDIEAYYKKLTEMSAEIIEPPTRRPWGAYNMVFHDPDGNIVYLRQLN